MYHAVIKVQAHDDFSLTVAFDDGAEGVLDMRPFLDFGVFRKLKDPDTFKRVQVAFDTASWDCGVDLDPEFVRARCTILRNS